MAASVRHRVLLVDDDPKILSLLQRGLSFEGYQVSTGGDGLAIVTYLAETHAGSYSARGRASGYDGWGSSAPTAMRTSPLRSTRVPGSGSWWMTLPRP